MIDLREVRSVTDFQRNAKEYVGRLKRLEDPPRADGERPRRDLLFRTQAVIRNSSTGSMSWRPSLAIRVGLQDAREGRVRPARKALKELGSEAWNLKSKSPKPP